MKYLTICLLFLLGCHKKPLHNYQPGVLTKVYIQQKYCADNANGEYTCDHVRFVPQIVRVDR